MADETTPPTPPVLNPNGATTVTNAAPTPLTVPLPPLPPPEPEQMAPHANWPGEAMSYYVAGYDSALRGEAPEGPTAGSHPLWRQGYRDQKTESTGFDGGIVPFVDTSSAYSAAERETMRALVSQCRRQLAEINATPYGKVDAGTRIRVLYSLAESLKTEIKERGLKRIPVVAAFVSDKREKPVAGPTTATPSASSLGRFVNG